MKLKRKELNELMKQYCIVYSEVDDVVNFVAELLYLRRKKLTDDEPYATMTINSLLSAEREVYDLVDYISELEEDK